ncbi:TPA: hypothetical protein ACSP2Q_000121 [Aeromonas veronii]
MYLLKNKCSFTILFISLLFTGISNAEYKPTREDFIASARERYGITSPSKELIEGLRGEVSGFNSKAPIDFGNDVYMTSASVSERGTMIVRVTAKSATRFQVNPSLIKEKLTQIACNDNAISRGFDAGLGASMLLTTVDGFDIDTGVINKSRCAQYK